MRTTILFTILTMFACGQINLPCSVEKQFILGNVALTLPECYKVFFQDSLNRPSQAVLIKDGNTKLDLLIGGLGTDPKKLEQDHSLKLQIDTIHKHYLRQIGYFNNGNKFGVLLNIVDLNTNNLFNLLDRASDTTLKGHKFNYELSAYTSDKISLTKEEKDLFLKAFSKAQVIEQ